MNRELSPSQNGPNADLPNPLIFGVQSPSVESTSELLRRIADDARNAVERHKSDIAVRIREELEEDVSAGVSLNGRNFYVVVEEQTDKSLASVDMTLWAAWEAFAASAEPSQPTLWPLDLCGLDSTLAGWRSDLAAWRTNEALAKALPWVDELLTWSRTKAGPMPEIPVPRHQGGLIPEWSEGTWLCLVPAPGLSPPVSPAVIEWPTLEESLFGGRQRLSMSTGTRFAERVELLWSPDDPAERRELLEMAHLHRAVYLAEPLS
jgi:hypothetical protein